MYYLISGVVIILLIVLIEMFFLPLYRKKKIEKKLLILCETNKQLNFKIAKKELYDFIIEDDLNIIFIKCLFISSNSMITINNKDTWVLSYGGISQEKGKAFPQQKYLNELVPFLKKEYKMNKELKKIILVYPKTTQIVRYLNESELEEINIYKKPYGYQIMQFVNMKNLNIFF